MVVGDRCRSAKLQTGECTFGTGVRSGMKRAVSFKADGDGAREVEADVLGGPRRMVIMLGGFWIVLGRRNRFSMSEGLLYLLVCNVRKLSRRRVCIGYVGGTGVQLGRAGGVHNQVILGAGVCPSFFCAVNVWMAIVAMVFLKVVTFTCDGSPAQHFFSRGATQVLGISAPHPLEGCAYHLDCSWPDGS